ncbi:MAG: hypothetical protein ACRDYX_05550 [Egibacteraceae bacterium]
MLVIVRLVSPVACAISLNVSADAARERAKHPHLPGCSRLPLIELLENRDHPARSTSSDIDNDNLLGFLDFPGLGLGRVEEAIGGVQHTSPSRSTRTAARS